jgi:hypothetical protein
LPLIAASGASALAKPTVIRMLLIGTVIVRSRTIRVVLKFCGQKIGQKLVRAILFAAPKYLIDLK